jgi:hypothetical protein
MTKRWRRLPPVRFTTRVQGGAVELLIVADNVRRGSFVVDDVQLLPAGHY